MLRRSRSENGFTLVELMIVIAIISILVAIAVPNMYDARRTAYERSAIVAMRYIFDAQQIHHKKHGRYANSMAELAAAGLLTNNWKRGQGVFYNNGPWEFTTRVPTPGGQTVAQNQTSSFRVGCQPQGPATSPPTAKLKIGDQIYFMLANGQLYTHRFTAGCLLSHVDDICRYGNDAEFGRVGSYPYSEGQ